MICPTKYTLLCKVSFNYQSRERAWTPCCPPPPHPPSTHDGVFIVVTGIVCRLQFEAHSWRGASSALHGFGVRRQIPRLKFLRRRVFSRGPRQTAWSARNTGSCEIPPTEGVRTHESVIWGRAATRYAVKNGQVFHNRIQTRTFKVKGDFVGELNTAEVQRERGLFNLVHRRGFGFNQKRGWEQLSFFHLVLKLLQKLKSMFCFLGGFFFSIAAVKSTYANYEHEFFFFFLSESADKGTEGTYDDFTDRCIGFPLGHVRRPELGVLMQQNEIRPRVWQHILCWWFSVFPPVIIHFLHPSGSPCDYVTQTNVTVRWRQWTGRWSTLWKWIKAIIMREHTSLSQVRRWAHGEAVVFRQGRTGRGKKPSRGKHVSFKVKTRKWLFFFKELSL